VTVASIAASFVVLPDGITSEPVFGAVIAVVNPPERFECVFRLIALAENLILDFFDSVDKQCYDSP
jgi:hypothetical protein